MEFSYKELGLWKRIHFAKLENFNCPLCGGIVEENKYKKEDKHPDYKCTNGVCNTAFWIPKVKQQAHQLKPENLKSNLLFSPTNYDSGTLIILGEMSKCLEKIAEYTKQIVENTKIKDF